jgi:hypothetical protein
MATEAVEVKDPDVVEIPADMIQLGFDDDGMPKSEPTEKAAEVKDEPKAPTLAELKALERERDTEREARTRAEREATERGTALEAERTKGADIEKKLAKTQDQALGAHYHKTRSDYAARNGEFQQIVSAIAATEQLATSLEQQALAAEEAGDKAKALRLSREMARAEAHLAQLEAGKPGAEAAALEAKYLYEEADKVVRTPPVREEPKKEDAKPAVVTEQKPDPDQWISQWPKKTTGEWLKAHKDFVTDEAKHKQLMEFVSDYYNEGNPLHTKDFVKALNEKFDPSAIETEEVTVMADEPKDKPQAQQQKVTARSTPAAPVSQGGKYFSSTNMNAAQIKVPPDVVAFCKASGLDPTSYALEVREEIKRGEKPKEWLDPGYDRGIR